MEHSENTKTNVNINNLPSYEISNFLDSISIQKSQKQKNDVSKRTGSEETVVQKNVSNLPPSCESAEISKDNSNEQ